MTLRLSGDQSGRIGGVCHLKTWGRYWLLQEPFEAICDLRSCQAPRRWIKGGRRLRLCGGLPAQASGVCGFGGVTPSADRGREGFWPPLPPNRTCGFPAYGSPVASFLIGGI